MTTNSIITVTGTDAFSFLQGQLSNDLTKLDTEASLLSAWCNPKGRVICVPEIRKAPDGYTLTVPSELAGEIVKRLTIFRFRAKVEFVRETQTATVDMAERIEKGIAWIGAEQSEKYTPHMLNLDLLGAVDFDKGCYPGQEIVARTHYKGKSKRRTLRFESTHPVNAGDKISAADRNIGEVLNVANEALLAIISIAHSNEILNINQTRLKLMPLPYPMTQAGGPDH